MLVEVFERGANRAGQPLMRLGARPAKARRHAGRVDGLGWYFSRSSPRVVTFYFDASHDSAIAVAASISRSGARSSLREPSRSECRLLP
jgi:hypothetical protein